MTVPIARASGVLEAAENPGKLLLPAMENASSDQFDDGDDPAGGDEHAWQAFAQGDVEEVTESEILAAAEDGEWEQRNVVDHAVAMFVHRYSEVEGRSSPAEFWWGTFVGVATSVVVLGALSTTSIFMLVAVGWAPLALIPVVCCGIRRVHDHGMSGSELLRRSGIFQLGAPGDLNANEYGEPSTKYVGPTGKKLYRRAKPQSK